MSKLKDWAEKLNCREYGKELKPLEENALRDDNLVVVFGYSDDNIEMRGAICEEYGCYDGGYLEWLGSKFVRINKARSSETENPVITAQYGCCGDYSWLMSISGDVTHEKFIILEDGEKYCEGIIFDKNDLDAVSSNIPEVSKESLLKIRGVLENLLLADENGEADDWDYDEILSAAKLLGSKM